MPAIGSFHPILVHFAIALLVAGVLFRLVSLTGRAAFTGPAALVLILIGTGAASLSAKSGRDAHGPVEHMPGAVEPLVRHQRSGFQTRNVFLGVAALELVALALAVRAKRAKASPGLENKPRSALMLRAPLILSGVVGAAGLFFLYNAGRSGGRLVYSYAGGVGVRSGDPKDVGRLLLAGLFQQALLDRRAGRRAEAGALFDQAGRRFPDDPEVQLLAIESAIVDRDDGPAAIAALEKLDVSGAPKNLRLKKALLVIDAFEAASRPADAASALEAATREFPDVPRIRKRRKP